ncbi:hypothetical protein [Butyrivibrio sp. JL13D10]|uniref:hypothetical protein n=1 Tax=Butyrivibrio sp. JL13D10 TaxID=3236815 RepID=UPI0038B51521
MNDVKSRYGSYDPDKWQLYKIYDKIEELENLIMDARAKRKTVIADKMSVDNVYKAIIYIDKYIDKMDQQERRDFIEQIISEVNIYEDKTPVGQWIKSVKFRLPLISEDISIGLDKDDHVEKNKRPNPSAIKKIRCTIVYVRLQPIIREA